MGEQLSKTSLDKQSTDHSTASSSSSSSQAPEPQPITCSPQKMKQLSKPLKIKTTCFSKTNYNILPQTTNVAPKPIIQLLSQILYKIHTNFTANQSSSEFSEFLTSTIPNPDQSEPINPDIDRIDSLFQFITENLNSNEFKTQVSPNNKNLLQQWKTSVNKIMARNLQYFNYFQGQLLICAVMRLFFNQDTTYRFLNQLLQKVGHLLSQPDKLLTFIEELNHKCEQLFPKLRKRLAQNDLDFSFVYLNWILGMFSNALSKETCIRIWCKLSVSQNSTQLLHSIILSCIECLENHQSLNQSNNPQLEQIQFTNKRLTSMIDPLKIEQFLG